MKAGLTVGMRARESAEERVFLTVCARAVEKESAEGGEMAAKWGIVEKVDQLVDVRGDERAGRRDCARAAWWDVGWVCVEAVS